MHILLLISVVLSQKTRITNYIDNFVVTEIVLAELLDPTADDILTILGIDSPAEGDVLYGNASSGYSKLAKGTDGEFLTLTAGIPSWAAPGVGVFLPLAGGTMSGVIEMAGNAIDFSIANDNEERIVSSVNNQLNLFSGNVERLRLAQGTVSFLTSNAALNATKKLYFDADGGFENSIRESSNNLITFEAGSIDALHVYNDGIVLPATFKIRTDGSITGDTYIYESSSNVLSFVVNTNPVLALQNSIAHFTSLNTADMTLRIDTGLAGDDAILNLMENGVIKSQYMWDGLNNKVILSNTEGNIEINPSGNVLLGGDIDMNGTNSIIMDADADLLINGSVDDRLVVEAIGGANSNLQIFTNKIVLDNGIASRWEAAALSDDGGSGTKRTMGEMSWTVRDNTDLTEDASTEISLMKAGTLTQVMQIHMNQGRFKVEDIDLEIDQGFSFYLDGHGDTLIESAVADWMNLQVGGEFGVLMQESGTEVDVVFGALNALATDATFGFISIPSMAGTPTGTPTTRTGKVQMVYDTTDEILHIYNSGWVAHGTFPTVNQTGNSGDADMPPQGVSPMFIGRGISNHGAAALNLSTPTYENVFQVSSSIDNDGDANTVAVHGFGRATGAGSRTWGGNFIAWNFHATAAAAIACELNFGNNGASTGTTTGLLLVSQATGVSPPVNNRFIQMQHSGTTNSEVIDGIVFNGACMDGTGVMIKQLGSNSADKGIDFSSVTFGTAAIELAGGSYRNSIGSASVTVIPTQITDQVLPGIIIGGSYSDSSNGNLFQIASWLENDGDTNSVGVFGLGKADGASSAVWGGNFVAYTNLGTGTPAAIGCELNFGKLLANASATAFGLVIAAAGNNGGSAMIQMQANASNSAPDNGIIFNGDMCNGGDLILAQGAVSCASGIDFTAATFSSAAIHLANGHEIRWLTDTSIREGAANVLTYECNGNDSFTMADGGVFNAIHETGGPNIKCRSGLGANDSFIGRFVHTGDDSLGAITDYSYIETQIKNNVAATLTAIQAFVVRDGTGNFSTFHRNRGDLDEIDILKTVNITDGKNISVGTTTGTQIGESSSQKLGFFGVTPVVQQTGVAVTAAGIHAALVTLGLITT